MAKKKQYDISELEGLKELFNDAVEEMAHEVLFQIEAIYESAIDKFYADYNPLYYNRTHSTYLASSGYDNLFSSQNIYGTENKWTAGITIDSSYIPGDPYRADKHWVFERTFAKGIHGINAGKVWGHDLSKTFTKYKGSYNSTFKVGFNPGYTLYQTKYYSPEGFSIMQRTMSNMVPAPRALVNNQFKALTRKKNMKRMFREILDSKLG